MSYGVNCGYMNKIVVYLLKKYKLSSKLLIGRQNKNSVITFMTNHDFVWSVKSKIYHL